MDRYYKNFELCIDLEEEYGISHKTKEKFNYDKAIQKAKEFENLKLKKIKF